MTPYFLLKQFFFLRTEIFLLFSLLWPEGLEGGPPFLCTPLVVTAAVMGTGVKRSCGGSGGYLVTAAVAMGN